MDWLKTEILVGFQKLLCLSLERQPASDLIDGTVLAWLEVIGDRFRHPEVDRQRVRDAFRKLAETRRTWPVPADFLDVLPDPPPAALALPAKPHDPQVVKAIMRNIANALGVPRHGSKGRGDA